MTFADALTEVEHVVLYPSDEPVIAAAKVLAAAILSAASENAAALDRLGLGSVDAPGPLEAIAMALGGSGVRGDISASLGDIATAIADK